VVCGKIDTKVRIHEISDRKGGGEESRLYLCQEAQQIILGGLKLQAAIIQFAQ